jgi:hypothetical protein
LAAVVVAGLMEVLAAVVVLLYLERALQFRQETHSL